MPLDPFCCPECGEKVLLYRRSISSPVEHPKCKCGGLMGVDFSALSFQVRGGPTPPMMSSPEREKWERTLGEKVETVQDVDRVLKSKGLHRVD